jgi:DNA modification methylase
MPTFVGIMTNVILLPTTDLRVSDTHNHLYGKDERMDSLFIETIKREGILTPLIISQDSYIISGVLRYRAAIELGIVQVPVIISESPFKDYEVAILNQGRRKTESMRLAEYELLKPYFKVGQGARTDCTGATPKLKEEKVFGCSKKHMERLESVKKISIKLYGSPDAPECLEIWRDIDSGKKAVAPTLDLLKKKLNEKKSEKSLAPPDPKEAIGANHVFKTNYRVFNKNSNDLNELENESVQTIVCSPPYHSKRDYEIGEDQLGQESDPNEYVRRLVDHFEDCKRVLKKEGSLFVNLGDYIDPKYKQYPLLPYRFALSMMENDWLLTDCILWLRTNPIFTMGDRTVKCDEVVFHFVKSPNYYYNLDWISEVQGRMEFTGNGPILYGENALKAKPRSVFDFRGYNVIDSAVPSTTWLRNECERRGIPYTHSATFPEIIPEVLIRTTSKVGDLIMDLFHGTGTTGAVTTILRRRYVGFELNPDYINQSIVRFESTEITNSNLLIPAA